MATAGSTGGGGWAGEGAEKMPGGGLSGSGRPGAAAEVPRACEDEESSLEE